MFRTRLLHAFLVATAVLLALAPPTLAADGGLGADRGGDPGGHGRSSAVAQAGRPVRPGDGQAQIGDREGPEAERPAPSGEHRAGRGGGPERRAANRGGEEGTPPPVPVPSPVPAMAVAVSSSPAAPAATKPAPPRPAATPEQGAPRPPVAPRSPKPEARPSITFWRPHPPVLAAGGGLPPGPSLAGLSDQAATLPLMPAGIPALAGLLMLALSAALATARRRRNHELSVALGAQLGVSPRSLATVPAGVLRRLSSQVAFDELTGVLRRAAGMAAVEREIKRARRAGSELAVAFIDVDGLKTVNDESGHAAGDQLLRRVAALLGGRLRGEDLVFRYGGDEFVCLMAGTGAVAAGALMDAIRIDAAASGLHFSLGVAAVRPGDDAGSLLSRADHALYARRGRRRSR